MTQPTRVNTTIRLSEDERTEFETIMKEYGYTEMSPFIRFAVRKLNEAKR